MNTMHLTDKDIQEYKKVYFEEYWKEISDQEALDQWLALVNLMKICLDGDKKD